MGTEDLRVRSVIIEWRAERFLELYPHISDDEAFGANAFMSQRVVAHLVGLVRVRGLSTEIQLARDLNWIHAKTYAATLLTLLKPFIQEKSAVPIELPLLPRFTPLSNTSPAASSITLEHPPSS